MLHQNAAKQGRKVVYCVVLVLWAGTAQGLRRLGARPHLQFHYEQGSSASEQEHAPGGQSEDAQYRPDCKPVQAGTQPGMVEDERDRAAASAHEAGQESRANDLKLGR